jgi:hypothetical protein
VGIGALADVSARPFFVLWHRVRACQANFGDLFMPNNCQAIAHRQLSQLHQAQVFYSHKHTYSAVRPAAQYARFLPEHKRPAFEDAIPRRLASLALCPRLQNEVDAFVATMPAGIVGLHVRRTDFPRDKDCDIVLQQRLDAEIKTTPDVQFLLCTDNYHSVQQLRERYGDRIYWRDQDMNRKGKRKTTIADAAIDLFVLAQTTRIIGQHRSSFCAVASQLGQIPIERI